MTGVQTCALPIYIPDLTADFAWKGQKPSLKETAFAEKWDALAKVGLKSKKVSVSSVILLDDLYQSGITMQFVASHIISAGSKQVYGLSLVKSRRDSDNQ